MAATPRLKKRGTGTVGGAGMRIEGLKDLLSKLELLPQRFRRGPLLKALRAGGKITLDRAKDTAPEGKRKLKSIRTDLLGKSPRVMRKRLKESLWLKTWPQPRDKTSKPSTAIIGPRSWMAPHAWLVHNGTDPHNIRSRNSVTMMRITRKGKEDIYAFGVRHPGARAQPWLANALRSTQGQVFRKVSTEFESRIHMALNKHGVIP